MIEMKDLRVGQKVLLKTRQQLLACGYHYIDDGIMRNGESPIIIGSMMSFLGKVVTVESLFWGNFKIKEGVISCSWAPNTIARLYDTSEEEKK